MVITYKIHFVILDKWNTDVQRSRHMNSDIRKLCTIIKKLMKFVCKIVLIFLFVSPWALNCYWVVILMFWQIWIWNVIFARENLTLLFKFVSVDISGSKHQNSKTQQLSALPEVEKTPFTGNWTFPIEIKWRRWHNFVRIFQTKLWNEFLMISHK